MDSKLVFSERRDKRLDSASSGVCGVLPGDVALTGVIGVEQPATFLIVSGLISKSLCLGGNGFGVEVEDLLLSDRGATWSPSSPGGIESKEGLVS